MQIEILVGDDMNENEEYPQIVLETNGTYKIYIEPEVIVHFASEKSIEDFIKNKNFKIIGKDSPKSMVERLRD
ncbi:hypothetical protein [Methanobrevibacter sp.]|uniref:hypothetical protein n=1 Tax=Methanobrevibacter sp. TaxID=66852 RepID=UPI003D7CE421